MKGWSAYTKNGQNTDDEQKTWEFKENTKECDGKCPKAKEIKRTITISEKAENQIRTLLKHVENLEWMATLIGRKTEDGNIIVDKLYLPEQVAEIAHIQPTKEGDMEIQKLKNKVGWIHSHNTMNAYFSRNDMETASQNNVSIVVNNKLETKAMITETLPCGEQILLEAKVETINKEDKTLVQKIKEKIKEKIQTKEKEPEKRHKWDIAYGSTVKRGQNWQTETEDQKRTWSPGSKRPKNMSKKEWKQSKKEVLLEMECDAKGWTGTCHFCQSKITTQDTARLVGGLLHHSECAKIQEGDIEDYITYCP